MRNNKKRVNIYYLCTMKSHIKTPNEFKLIAVYSFIIHFLSHGTSSV